MALNPPFKSQAIRRNPQTGTDNGATPRLAPIPYPTVVPPRFRKGHLQRSPNTLPPHFRKGIIQTLEEMTPVDGGEDGDMQGVPPGSSPEPSASMTGEVEVKDEKPHKSKSPVQGKEQNEGIDPPEEDVSLAVVLIARVTAWLA
ncbi:hypothetical protein BDN72DRAFT_218901 [Pluteus cervinus]|uniref:Uncharacterized protein n=1 Tax=Pluteus cervinus TaxID=181527 RepID=A0ACD3AHR9_9AGAR|nr:hypothetical protein BDN72DRAFT_218901 [Pluteus cervinus]